MSKKIIIASIVVLGLLVALVVFSVTQSPQKKNETSSVVQEDQEMMKPEETKTPKQEAMEKEKTKIGKEESRYIPYTKAAYEQGKDKQRVLYFYASWCPTCKIANDDLTQNPSKIPEDVVVLRVNYNDPDTDEEEKDLAKKYGITYQHTFVQTDSQGKEVTKWNGGGLDELIVRIK